MLIWGGSEFGVDVLRQSFVVSFSCRVVAHRIEKFDELWVGLSVDPLKFDSFVFKRLKGVTREEERVW